MTTTKTKVRTITMSKRPPVKIREDEWPSIASSTWYEGEIESQANRSAWMKVRRHADGRTLIYAGSSTSWRGERDQRSGLLLDADESGADVAAAIYEVADEIGYAEQLAAECVGNLPAEEI